jgi:hypothetical protein
MITKWRYRIPLIGTLTGKKSTNGTIILAKTVGQEEGPTALPSCMLTTLFEKETPAVSKLCRTDSDV